MFNKNILLSICIPTYNRCSLLKRQINNIYSQLAKTEKDLVEVIVSVNPAGDGSEKYLQEFAKKEDIIININQQNIGGVKNIYEAIDRASGKYIWIVSDDDQLLPGLLHKVVTVLKKNPRLAWVFINAARLNGDPYDKNSKIVNPKYYWGKGGKFKNGKQALIDKFKVLDGAVLFSTSNILLRESAVKVKEKNETENMCSLLTCTFESALHGEAYIFEEIMILAGGNISWSDKVYEVEVHQFNQALLQLENWGYTKKEVMKIIRYRMTHKAIFLWFHIIKSIPKNYRRAVESIKFYFSFMPGITIFSLLFSPIFAVYLFARHGIKTIIRKRYIDTMKNNRETLSEIRKHC